MNRRAFFVTVSAIALISAGWTHGAPPTIVTPVLALTSPASDTKPDFSADIDPTVTVGDVLTLYVSTSSDFTTGVTTKTMTLTAALASTGELLPTLSALSDGTYYCKLTHARTGFRTGTSNTLTITVTAATVFPQFTKVYNPAGITSSACCYIFDNVPIGGAARSTRKIIASVSTYSAVDLSGVTCDLHDGNGPQAMSKVVDSGYTSFHVCGQWEIAAPSGALADIVISSTDLIFECVLTVAVIDTSGASASATQGTGYSNPADDFTLTAVTIPAGGLAIATMQRAPPQGTAITWKNNYSLQYRGATPASHTQDMALSTTAGSSAASATRGSQSTAMCVSAWAA